MNIELGIAKFEELFDHGYRNHKVILSIMEKELSGSYEEAKTIMINYRNNMIVKANILSDKRPRKLK